MERDWDAWRLDQEFARLEEERLERREAQAELARIRQMRRDELEQAIYGEDAS